MLADGRIHPLKDHVQFVARCTAGFLRSSIRDFELSVFETLEYGVRKLIERHTERVQARASKIGILPQAARSQSPSPASQKVDVLKIV